MEACGLGGALWGCPPHCRLETRNPTARLGRREREAARQQASLVAREGPKEGLEEGLKEVGR